MGAAIAGNVFMSFRLFDPSPHWKNTRALAHARERALALARRLKQEQDTKAAAAPEKESLVFKDAHDGGWHLDFFRAQFPQLLDGLPRDFRAVELGAGMGWHAALLAAVGAGLVVATEVGWTKQTPSCISNAFTLHRLARRELKLNDVLRFEFDAASELRAVRFSERIQFVGASAAAPPLADQSVDILYSINCIEHLPELARCFEQAERVLKPGGIFFVSSEPFFFSPFGHHMRDCFPIPWGHLLWNGEELADLIVREAGEGVEWRPGEPLSARHIRDEVFSTLNQATPAAIRRILRAGQWRIRGWVDMHEPRQEEWGKELRLREALRGIPDEALFLVGLRWHLERADASLGMRIPLRLSHRLRAWIKRIKF